MSLPNHKLFGFTLIELLVVISIIGIMAGFGAVSYSNAQQKSRDGQRKADLKGVQQALELYFQRMGHYPDGNGAGPIVCWDDSTGTVILTTVTFGSAFTCHGETWMTLLPKDPSGINEYWYTSPGSPGASDPNTSYYIYAKLENTDDPDISGPLPCPAQGTYNYCVKFP